MMMSKLALTSGNWEVCGKGLWVDLKCQMVYFMAVRESPLEKHLYAVSLKSPGNIKLLTKPGSSYEIDIDKVKFILLDFNIVYTVLLFNFFNVYLNYYLVKKLVLLSKSRCHIQ